MESNTIVLIVFAALFPFLAALLFIFTKRITSQISYPLRDILRESVYRNDHQTNSQTEELKYIINKFSSNIESFMSFQDKFQMYLEDSRLAGKSVDKLQMKILNYLEESKSGIYEQKEFIYLLKNLEEKLMSINLQFEKNIEKVLMQNSTQSNPILIDKIDRLNSLVNANFEKSKKLSGSKENFEPDQDKVIELVKKISSEYSHSIKTPLSSINSAISNLSDKIIPILKSDKSLINDSEILISFLENAKTSIEYINKILERGAGFLPGKIEEFKLNDAIRKAIRITREASNSKPQINTNFYEFKAIKLNWFSVFIALIQVLENAFDAIGDKLDGKISIITRLNESGNGIDIIISNNGGKIDTKNLDNIFQPNFSTKGKERGLGLSIALRCITEIDGSLKLIESTDENTSFIISFPINID